MRYISTRGEAPALGFIDVTLAGLARDGGLYVPREWPELSKKDIRGFRGKSYQDIAFAVQRALKESPFFDPADTTLSGENVAEPTTGTFRFGVKVKLKKPFKL